MNGYLQITEEQRERWIREPRKGDSRAARERDARVLDGVCRTPFAAGAQIAALHGWEDERAVRRALSRLEARGLCDHVAWHPEAGGQKALWFVTEAGLTELEERLGSRAPRPDWPLTMVSRQWQRHLVRHLDTVQVTYGLMVASAGLFGTRRRPWQVYFPRTGSLDALMWVDGEMASSVGIMRKGVLTNEAKVEGALRRLYASVDDGLERHTAPVGWHPVNPPRRGPGVVIVLVRTETEKYWLENFMARERTPSWAVATDAEAAQGRFIVPGVNGVVSLAALVGHLAAPAKTEYDPAVPVYKSSLPPVPRRKLPTVLAPVQWRVLECLYKWPLMRPTEIAPTIGTRYGGRYSGYLRDLREAGLVRTVRDIDLAGAGLKPYDSAEYRNLPLLLSDEGLKTLAAHDRVDAPALLSKFSVEGRDKATGDLAIGSFIKGLIGRERRHTMGVNAIVAQACAALPYTPQVLPDHLARRYFSNDRWVSAGTHRPATSVAPDAALLLRAGDHWRTILIEYERQARRGGRALIRKIDVWLKPGTGLYPGEEVVAFVVPTNAAKRLVINTFREWVGSNERLARRRPLVVAVEGDLKDDILTRPIWTLARNGQDVSLAPGMLP